MLFNSPLHDFIDSLDGDTEICKHKNSSLTANQLVKESLAKAEFLSKQGLAKGDIVLFIVETGIEFLILFMALVHLRVKIALVDPHMGPQLYQSKINQLKPKWAFVDRRILLMQENPLVQFLIKKARPATFYIKPQKSLLVFGTGPRVPLFKKPLSIKSISNQSELQDSNIDDELLIVYTSGSLSEPKGVVHSIGSIYEGLKAISKILENAPGKVMVSHLPHFALIGMFVGYKVHFWPENLSPKAKIAFIKKHNIDTIFGPPAEFLALINYCSEKKLRFPKSLAHIILGSAPILKPFLLKFKNFYQGKITCYYGMTENPLISTIDGNDKITSNYTKDFLGQPSKDLSFKLKDDGELMIKSPWLFKRYFNHENVEGFFATGDLVQAQENKDFIMLGRKKNMIIRMHKNIYPALYEPTIDAIPNVIYSCMIGIYNKQKHDEDVYLMVETNDKTLTENEILAHLKKGKYSIDTDALPDKIIIGTIPRFGRQQKVDYQTLRQVLTP